MREAKAVVTQYMKLVAKLLIIIALIFGIGLVFSDSSNGFNIHKPVFYAVPEDAVDYSDELYKDKIDEMLENGEDHLAVNFLNGGGTPVAELAQDFIYDIERFDVSFIYLVEDFDCVFEEKFYYTTVNLYVLYAPEKSDISSIPLVSDEKSLVNNMITQLGENKTKLTFITNDFFLDYNTINNGFLHAYYNSATTYCPIETHITDYRQNSCPEVIYEVELTYHNGIDEQLILEKNSELAAAVKEIADSVREKHITDSRSMYLAIHNIIIARVSYDDSLVGVSDTAEAMLQRSAYGALIQGKTVCSGYAHAFKLICDELDLPCWVVSCKYEGEAHAINAVMYENKVYYIDCTFDDGGWGRRFFFFTENSYEFFGYSINEMVYPW